MSSTDGTRTYPVGEEISVEADGPVRIVRLNRPASFNAADEGLHRALTRIWSALSDDPDARAIVLTGEGPAFCAGGDMSTLARVQVDVEARRRMITEAGEIMRAMATFRLPAVACVHGPAIGLGCSLAVSCDAVLMGASAYMADPHVAVGLVAGDGGAVLWPLLMSMLKAKEYLYTGDRISADEAVALGLATRVVPDEEVFERSLALAHRFAALPPRALQDTKLALAIHVQKAMAGVLEYALAAESECFITEEHQEAVASFLRRSGG